MDVGFDPSAVAQWKKRSGKPRAEISKKLADYFSVPVETLLNDDLDLPSVAAEKQVAAQLGLVADSYGNMHIADPEAPEIAWRAAILKDVEEARGKIAEAQAMLDNLLRLLSPPNVKSKGQRKT